MVKAIDDVATHAFFAKKVKFANRRYQHKEAAVRLLFLVHCLRSNKLIDTKKPYLDQFTLDHKKGKLKDVKVLKDEVVRMLDRILPVFVDKDSLLIAQASLPIYAFIPGFLDKKGKGSLFARTRLDKFNQKRTENRALAEADITKANFELLEYDRLSQQGTNDANSIRERWRILENWLLATP
jgi:hypothetical protein